MKKAIFIAIMIVLFTFVSGSILNLLGLNHWISCNGLDGSIHPMTFSLISSLCLAYAVWSNRKRTVPDEKATVLVLLTFLFAPIIGFMLQVSIPLYKHAFLSGSDIGITLYLLTLLFMLCVGNYVTTTRQNNLGGICNRWTLSNSAIWVRTQRIYSRFIVFGGLATIPVIFVYEISLGTVALVIVFIISSIIARFYAYILSQSQQLAA